LWRISGNGLNQPSYLFGAIDEICPSEYLWTKSIEDCYVKSDKICLQINISDPAIVKTVTAGLVDKNGPQLESYFSKVSYLTVMRYAKDTLHIDLTKLQMVKPVGIQPYIVKQLLHCTDAVSYSKRIMEKAKTDHKEILGLDSGSEVLKEIEATHFNEFVATALTEMATGSNYYYQYRTSLMNAYKQQDIQQVNSIFKNAKSFTPLDIKVLLHEKSERWVSRMIPMMKISSIFFSLNVINLGGSDGVIEILKKDGYSVEPIY